MQKNKLIRKPMISIVCRDERLKVIIVNEKITIKKTKALVGKGVRVIPQNKVKSVSIEYDEFSILDKNAIVFLNKILCIKNNISVEMNMV